MNPVMQTIMGDKGNCFNACIASLLNINIDDVPVLDSFQDGEWSAQLNEWLYPRGLVYFDIRIAKSEAGLFFKDKDFYHVLTGPSPRLPGLDHCVIGRKGKIVHDPHPEGTGLIDKQTYLTIGILVMRCMEDALTKSRRIAIENEQYVP